MNPQIPIAHRDDPITSYEAGDKMLRSGKLQKQENEVLELIKHFVNWCKPTFTAKELSNNGFYGYFIIQRRLSGLHRKGKIERTGEKRRGCAVWRLK